MHSAKALASIVIGSIMSGLRQALRFSGRSSRTEFRLFLAFWFFIGQHVLALFLRPALSLLDPRIQGRTFTAWLTVVPPIVTSPILTAASRRTQYIADQRRSGEPHVLDPVGYPDIAEPAGHHLDGQKRHIWPEPIRGGSTGMSHFTTSFLQPFILVRPGHAPLTRPHSIQGDHSGAIR